MNHASEDVMLRYSQFSDHLSQLRTMDDSAITKAELIVAAQSGHLVARQRLQLTDGTVFNPGDTIPIPAEHAFCNPTMVTTKERQANSAKYLAAKDHQPVLNALANNVQQARRIVGDTESLVSTLPTPIKTVNKALQQQRQRQKIAEAELSDALNRFYTS